MSKETAVSLLRESPWFKNASASMLEKLADKMTLQEADDGFLFVKEGDEIKNVLVLQEGSLVRTKLSVEDAAVAHEEWTEEEIKEHSIVVDEITGTGKITGLLHSVETGGHAYATISAAGPTKVWLLPGEDLRDIVCGEPQFALDLMSALARELRSGTKSLRNVLRRVRNSTSNLEEAGKKPFRVLCYDATSWTTDGFKAALEVYQKEEHDVDIKMEFTTERLSQQSACFAAGYDAVCLFVNDTADAPVLKTLSLLGVRLVLMRCAGFDRVDTKAALAFDLTVARVPAYSPYAVAEMGIALLMSVNRRINKASNRVRMANFSLDGGLMGMDIHGKTVGVMGTGKIGQILCDIMLGFGVNLLCYDVFENDEVKAKGGKYVSKDEIYAQSDILFLMMPLLAPTYHTINHDVLAKLKPGVILINTSRGGLVDTKALLEGLRTGVIGGCGMDVYENEQAYFFQDWSAGHIEDPDLEALLGNNNVVLTAHQAFFTKEAVNKIVDTTIENIGFYCEGKRGLSHPNNCIPAPKSA
eukprot:Nitzschia sp. Nitz4//scaffold16_size188269//145042//147064//NITZ4_001812-RA/size188269-augustus-gene-0.98-mRNA-1//-1//CDS//3329538580//4898//frame0